MMRSQMNKTSDGVMLESLHPGVTNPSPMGNPFASARVWTTTPPPPSGQSPVSPSAASVASPETSPAPTTSSVSPAPCSTNGTRTDGTLPMGSSQTRPNRSSSTHHEIACNPDHSPRVCRARVTAWISSRSTPAARLSAPAVIGHGNGPHHQPAIAVLPYVISRPTLSPSTWGMAWTARSVGATPYPPGTACTIAGLTLDRGSATRSARSTPTATNTPRPISSVIARPATGGIPVPTRDGMAAGAAIAPWRHGSLS